MRRRALPKVGEASTQLNTGNPPKVRLTDAQCVYLHQEVFPSLGEGCDGVEDVLSRRLRERRLRVSWIRLRYTTLYALYDSTTITTCYVFTFFVS